MALLRLCVKDILDMKQIRIWNGKGLKHRLITLAMELKPAIQRQIITVAHLLQHISCKVGWIFETYNSSLVTLTSKPLNFYPLIQNQYNY
jgi:hypothetical protein